MSTASKDAASELDFSYECQHLRRVKLSTNPELDFSYERQHLRRVKLSTTSKDTASDANSSFRGFFCGT